MAYLLIYIHKKCRFYSILYIAHQIFPYLTPAASVGFSVLPLLFGFFSSSAADDDTLRLFLSLFFFFAFLSSGSLSELELLEEDDEPELVLDELLSESELELEELLDVVLFFLLPAMNTITSITYKAL